MFIANKYITTGGIGLILLLIMLIYALLDDTPQTIEKIVEVEKEIIVEKEIVIEPYYTYNLTSEEREMLARLVYREANIESYECQKAVVSVVINRWLSGKWGNTLKEVIYAPYQFEPAKLLSHTTPNEANYKAVDEVLTHGSTLPSYVLYFRSDYHFSWSGYIPYSCIDNTYFGYLVADLSQVHSIN